MTLRSFTVTHKIKEEQSQSLNYSLPRIMKKDTIIKQGVINFPISISINRVSSPKHSDSWGFQCQPGALRSYGDAGCCDDYAVAMIDYAVRCAQIPFEWEEVSSVSVHPPPDLSDGCLSIRFGERRMGQKHNQWKGKSAPVLAKLCELQLRGETRKDPCHSSTLTGSQSFKTSYSSFLVNLFVIHTLEVNMTVWV